METPIEVTLENYQELAQRTSSTSKYPGQLDVLDTLDFSHVEIVRLLHGAIGLCTEAGEIQDTLKKHLFYAADLDENNLIEECGDVLWYLAEILNALKIPLQKVMQANISKLAVRYPEKFDSEMAIVRDAQAEMEAVSKEISKDKK